MNKVPSGPLPYDAFLSYSSRDRTRVLQLAERLRHDGLRIWLDCWNVAPGGNIYAEVVSGVIGARFLVQCLSPNGLGSQWATAEREIILIDDPTNRRCRYVPLLLDTVDLPPDLRRFRYVDWREGNDAGYRELRDCLSQPDAAHDRSAPPLRRPNTAAVYHGGAAPIAPPQLFGRERDIDFVHRAIGNPSGNSVAAIYGWPGVGKTVVAATVAHDDNTAARFPDGILWATVGETPDYGGILRYWAVARGLNPTRDATVDELRVLLHEQLSTSRVLVILDDVWLPSTSQLMVGGSESRTLITTRSPHIARLFTNMEASIHRLDVLTDHDALTLLRAVAPNAVEQFPALAAKLVAQLEYLPLAIKVAGRLLQTQAAVDPAFDLQQLFMELRELRRLLDEAPPSDIPHPAAMISPTVAALLTTSVTRLPAEIRDRFLALAVLAPAPAVFSRNHASVTMVLHGKELSRTLTVLYESGLIEPVPDGQFWIHAMLVATAKWMQ